MVPDPLENVLREIGATMGRLESKVADLDTRLTEVDGHVRLLVSERNQVVGGAKVAVWLFGALGALLFWFVDRVWK